MPVLRKQRTLLRAAQRHKTHARPSFRKAAFLIPFPTYRYFCSLKRYYDFMFNEKTIECRPIQNTFKRIRNFVHVMCVPVTKARRVLGLLTEEKASGYGW